jgi:hypothetical protein
MARIDKYIFIPHFLFGGSYSQGPDEEEERLVLYHGGVFKESLDRFRPHETLIVLWTKKETFDNGIISNRNNRCWVYLLLFASPDVSTLSVKLPWCLVSIHLLV